MGVETLLSRLHGVRPTGPGRWAALCPAHEDRRPSLGIRQADDGRVLIVCRAGCHSLTVLHCVGMEFTDLFPEPLTPERLPRIRAPFSALDALKTLAEESAVVAIMAANLAEGEAPSEDDKDRACEAAGRIATALEAVHGQPHRTH